LAETAHEGHPRRWAILAVLILSEFVVELDSTIVNIALPDIAADLNASASTLQWVVDAYILTLVGLLLLSGALGDRWGYRRVLFAGLGLFGAAAVVASVATSADVLIGARALMGVGGALILPTTLASITHVFSAEERARALSIWAATAGLSFVLGPVLGGALVDASGWPAVFLVNLPIVGLAFVGVALLVPRGGNSVRSAPDLVGAALSTGGLGFLVFAIVEAPKHGWTAAGTLAELAVAVLFLAAFVTWEARTSSPMLDLGLFRSVRFSASAAAAVLTFVAIGGMLFVLTQVLQDVQGHSALGAGLRLLPVAGVLILVSPVSVVLAARFGTKVPVGIGLAVLAVGFAILTSVDTGTDYTNIAVALVVAGAGYGLAFTPIIDTMTVESSLSRVGATFGLSNAVIMTGLALGVAVIGSIVSTRYGDVLGPVAQLSRDDADAVRESIGQAVALGRSLPAPGSDALIASARDAFVNAAAVGFAVSAGIAAAGAVVAAAFLPSRRRPQEAVPAAVAQSGPAREAERAVATDA
jgi:EmrB/QacA subfamily drug resistance transporter